MKLLLGSGNLNLTYLKLIVLYLCVYFIPSFSYARSLQQVHQEKFRSEDQLSQKKSTKDEVHPIITGELKRWHKVVLTFNGPEVSENEEYNPFFNYRLNVRFTNELTGKSYLVPGFFAADGNAAETSATKGKKWRVIFCPDDIGRWDYLVDFRKGNWVAVSDRKSPGVSGGFMDGSQGHFSIGETNKKGRDFRGKGRLEYVGKRYLRFAGTGEYFLKMGPDAPENFLAYADFDGTFQNDGHKDNLVKTWEAHLEDWKEGDPVWKGNKGKAIIGAINYLASKGLNSVSFLTNNIKGDDQNVFPYIDYDTYDRFDVSKLAQWEIVFEHADKLGIFLHFKTLEQENQGLLDHGGVGAYSKLYYRELIARFGHHLALNWNLGEENGDWVKNHKTPPQFTEERKAMATYFNQHDPYHHPIVIHNGVSFNDLLGPECALTGPSVQTNYRDFRTVHKTVLKWIRLSKEAGKQWTVAVDEPGDAQHALIPDDEDPDHDFARMNALWGTLMAGGWGNEWYFGYKHSNSDLTCQDYRSRDLFWDQCDIALCFFEDHHIPVQEMDNHDEYINNLDENNRKFCLAKANEIYLIYLATVQTTTLDLTQADGKYEVSWFNPRTGGALTKGSVKAVTGGQIVTIGDAPKNDGKDWLVLVQKIDDKK